MLIGISFLISFSAACLHQQQIAVCGAVSMRLHDPQPTHFPNLDVSAADLFNINDNGEKHVKTKAALLQRKYITLNI